MVFLEEPRRGAKKIESENDRRERESTSHCDALCVARTPFSLCNPLFHGLHIAPKASHVSSFLIIRFPVEQHIFEDVGKRDDPSQAVIVIDDHQPMNPRLANGIENGIEPILLATGVDSGEILRALQQGLAHADGELLVGAALDQGNHVDGLEEVQDPAILIQDGHAGDARLHHHVDDVDDGCIHGGRLQVAVGAEADVRDTLLQELRLDDVDGDELQQPVLRDDADDHLATRLVVDVDEGDAAGARLQHLATGLVEGTCRMDGQGFEGRHANGLLDVWTPFSVICRGPRTSAAYLSRNSSGTGRSG